MELLIDNSEPISAQRLLITESASTNPPPAHAWSTHHLTHNPARNLLKLRSKRPLHFPQFGLNRLMHLRYVLQPGVFNDSAGKLLKVLKFVFADMENNFPVDGFVVVHGDIAEANCLAQVL